MPKRSRASASPRVDQPSSPSVVEPAPATVLRDVEPNVASPPIGWAKLDQPDFTNSSKDDVVNAYFALLSQYNDLIDRHAMLISIGQSKDWGFVNDERKNQLEAALSQIGALLLQASPTQAVQIAGQIVGIVQQVMPGVLPSPAGTPLAQ